MNFDWKGLIGTVAPGLASAFGTPVAGLAVGAICKALGLTPTASEAEIESKMAAASPADLLALKASEQQFQKDMKSLDIDLEKISAGDRDSARKMQISTRSLTVPILSWGVTIGFFSILIGMLAGFLHTKDSPELLLLIGSLSTAWGMVMSFHFGTTSASRSKDDTINSLSK